MKIELRPLELSALDALRCEVLVVPYFGDERPLQGLGGLVDWRQYGKISAMQLDSVMTGAFGEKVWTALERPLRVPKAMFFGLGPSAAGFGAEQLNEACKVLVQSLLDADLRVIALGLPGRSTSAIDADQALNAWLSALGSQASILDLIIFDETTAQRALRKVMHSTPASP